jgi:hypothetical protein
MFENWDSKQKTIAFLIGGAIFLYLLSKGTTWFSDNRDLSMILVGCVIGGIIAWILLKQPLPTNLDPKEAARLMFVCTKFGRDILNKHGVVRLGEGISAIPQLNFGACSTYRRGDGVGGIFGKMFPNDPLHYYIVLDLRNKSVSDNNSNLVHFGQGPMDTKSFEKELERLVPFESAPVMRLARKAQVEAQKKEAEAMAEEM